MITVTVLYIALAFDIYVLYFLYVISVHNRLGVLSIENENKSEIKKKNNNKITAIFKGLNFAHATYTYAVAEPTLTINHFLK